ncbi:MULTISPECIES: DUF5806 family protein [unclassified Halorubrum]|jgi:hypothetical protein|uniref:DUF5806 family protein n=1 Tax=unclassified Halorubrum TaxID=2642239 RepID=UPI0010F4C44E|nr:MULTISPECIES: DUF5806 family protein [unclassified Halorubrum]TKX42414.1 hypothetical protein EXE50_14580 [Halorubrum sp. ARQ200]TKX48845.1 hypothetical protein EXE49_14555 [Halorubrum sp. ASP121]
MSDNTGPAADDAERTGDAAADRVPSEGGDGGEATGGDPTAPDEDAAAEDATDGENAAADDATDVPRDVQKYERFQKMDGARYERVNEFLRDRTYITAREWAIARLCADFRTETGVEMTKIGENLPELVPFMTDTYTPQAVNQARYSFEEKVTKAGATFLYGAMSGFFTAEDLDEMMYEVTEVAKFLLEVEGVDLAVADELEAEDKISEVMRDVRASSADLRGEEVRCPECGHVHEPEE